MTNVYANWPYRFCSDVATKPAFSLPPRGIQDKPPIERKKKKRPPKSPPPDSEAEQVLSGQETQDDVEIDGHGVTSDDPDQTLVKKKKKGRRKKKPGMFLYVFTMFDLDVYSS